MYNFSGIWFRIWGVCGAILLLGVVCILLEKPWSNTFKLRDCKIGLICIVIALLFGVGYFKSILSPDVSSYTGEFMSANRNSRVAPPLPVTFQYAFWNGDEQKLVFYLDAFSKKEIFPYEFEQGKEYTIYYDSRTNIIVKVEPLG